MLNLRDKIDKAIKMDSINVVKADAMMEKIESCITEKNIVELFSDLKERYYIVYMSEIYVSLWSMLLYDRGKAPFVIKQYNMQGYDVRLKFKKIFEKTKKTIEGLESENMSDDDESPYLFLLSIENLF